MRIVRSTMALAAMAMGARAQTGATILAGALSTSSNPAAQSFGSVLNTGLNSQTGTAILGQAAGSSDLGDVVNALAAGYSLSEQIPECKASVQGQEATINDAYAVVAPLLSNSANQQAASSFAMAAFKAYSTSTSDEMLLYKLYQIYQAEQEDGAPQLTEAQEDAFDQLTPECTEAFDSITEAYDSGSSAAGLGSQNNVTCNTYMSQDRTAQFGLCVLPPRMHTVGNAARANLTAIFTNYGVPVCNVTFFIRDIETNTLLQPSWLPVASRAYPNGIPQNTEINMKAQVAWSQEMALPALYTIWDVFPGWSACPAVTPAATPAATVAATAAATPAATTPKATYAGIISAQPACLQTNDCKAVVAGFGQGTECEQYSLLLQSQCSTCAGSVMDAVAKQCQNFCSAEQCALASPKASTSPASHGATASAVILGAAIAAAAALF